MRPSSIFGSKIYWKQFAPALVAVLNTFVWYTLTYSAFTSVVESLLISPLEKTILFSMYFGGTAASAILGAIFLRSPRKSILGIWMLGGAVVTSLMVAMPTGTVATNGLISMLLGASLGVGLPSCLAYFAEATNIKSRGTCGGITWGAAGVVTLVLAMLVTNFDLTFTSVVLAAWRVFGLLAFLPLAGAMTDNHPRSASPAFESILKSREALLYFVPWVMVSLVNFIEAPILDRLFGDLHIILGFVEFALIGIFALVGGILADLIGRKRVIITGFVMLGLGYAMLSLFSGTTFSWFLYISCDGIAWGAFSSVFLITLWGDLAQEREKEKYYVLGGLPFLLAGFLAILVKPYVEIVGTAAAFSLASFFLFLAVLPLMYAPETLPEQEIKNRELREYLAKAKEIREKHV